jgi:hypothetical protein
MYEGVYKIGFTKNSPYVRMKQLNTTGVPAPFKLEFAKRVYDYKYKERLLHRLLAQYGNRVNPKREFFRMSVDDIKMLFELMDGEDFDDADHVQMTAENR